MPIWSGRRQRSIVLDEEHNFRVGVVPRGEQEKGELGLLAADNNIANTLDGDRGRDAMAEPTGLGCKIEVQ